MCVQGGRVEEHVWGDLPPVASVMVGREAYNRPWMLRDAGHDPRLAGVTRRDVTHLAGCYVTRSRPRQQG